MHSQTSFLPEELRKWSCQIVTNSGNAFLSPPKEVPGDSTRSLARLSPLFAFYGLAGAQVAPRPPLLRTGLIAIGVIYTLRGLLLAPQLAAYMSNTPLLAPKDLGFSAVSLVIGLLYLLGTWQAWPDLRTARWRVA